MKRIVLVYTDPHDRHTNGNLTKEAEERNEQVMQLLRFRYQDFGTIRILHHDFKAKKNALHMASLLRLGPTEVEACGTIQSFEKFLELLRKEAADTVLLFDRKGNGLMIQIVNTWNKFAPLFGASEISETSLLKGPGLILEQTPIKPLETSSGLAVAS